MKIMHGTQHPITCRTLLGVSGDWVRWHGGKPEQHGMNIWRHYERAFERYLRARRVPYVAIEQARDVLLGRSDTTTRARGPAQTGVDGHKGLKYFDFVVYGEQRNLLVELKGRRVGTGKRAEEGKARAPRLECWTTLDDLGSLQRWEQLFGPPFEAVIVFVYWCDKEPPGALFQEIFEDEGRWYALRGVRVKDYVSAMRTRSPRWRTVDMTAEQFEALSAPFAPAGEGDPFALPVHRRVQPGFLELAARAAR
jgi:hypothetical protein